jgi:hypothetical protein
MQALLCARRPGLSYPGKLLLSDFHRKVDETMTIDHEFLAMLKIESNRRGSLNIPISNSADRDV